MNTLPSKKTVNSSRYLSTKKTEHQKLPYIKTYLNNKVVYRYLLPTRGILQRVQLAPQSRTEKNNELIFRQSLPAEKWCKQKIGPIIPNND
jgi:hypothetical protein